MSSFAPNFMQFAWLIFGLVIGVVQITAAVILIRDRGVGPWLMLVGAVMLLIASVGSRLLMVIFMRHFAASGISVFYGIASGLGGLGGLLFAGGLLIFALQRQALRRRIDELETIATTRP